MLRYVHSSAWPKGTLFFISFPLFTHLNLATVAAVALRAATLVAANVIDALAAILTRIRFAFIILEVAQLAGESCEEHKSEGGGKTGEKVAGNVNVQSKWNGNFNRKWRNAFAGDDALSRLSRNCPRLSVLASDFYVHLLSLWWSAIYANCVCANEIIYELQCRFLISTDFNSIAKAQFDCLKVRGFRGEKTETWFVRQ